MTFKRWWYRKPIEDRKDYIETLRGFIFLVLIVSISVVISLKIGENHDQIKKTNEQASPVLHISK